jgi:hypothetical protein
MILPWKMKLILLNKIKMILLNILPVDDEDDFTENSIDDPTMEMEDGR